MVCKFIPRVLTSGLWFSDKLQRNEQLLEMCLCCAGLFCIALARLDHIAPWVQWISLSKKNLETKKSGESRDCNLPSPKEGAITGKTHRKKRTAFPLSTDKNPMTKRGEGEDFWRLTTRCRYSIHHAR